VWVPSYRSQTWLSVEKGLAGDEAVMRSTFTVAYDSVLSAWQWFLAHTQGKPVILVGLAGLGDPHPPHRGRT
jgi:hypothetical protein